MRAKSRKSGLTLTEMTVVIAGMAVLAYFGLPAVRAFLHSFESGGGTKSMISAALASARAIAAKEQRYAGIRLQKAYNPDDPDNPLKAKQYMIFIIHDPEPAPNGTDLANGFRAVDGLEPIKLPESISVMDSSLIEENVDFDVNWEPSGYPEVTDLTTFSIVFSPSGKLTIHDVRVRNKHGRTSDTSNDDIFNTENNVTDPVNPVGLFIQDDYSLLGLHEEPSRNSFIIYDRKKFRKAYEKGQGYSGYLAQLVPEEEIFINPYTGTMISKD